MLDVGYKKVAKVYGTKPNIAKAMQARIVDPFTGTLAGMFIDSEQAKALSAQAPQRTVAQQVMGGLPPQAPPQAPPPPSGGLGATPQAGPPMAPQGGMPQGQGEMIEVPMPSDMQPEGMAAGGMVPPYASGGGLSDVPIPDTMFDENRNGGFNDGYAGGGLVAFANGGWGRTIEGTATRLIPGLGITSRQRSADKNAEVGGVPDSFHQTDDARDFVPPPGMSMAALHQKLKAQFGSEYDVLNEGDHVHIEPGPGLAKSGLAALTNPEQAANPRTPMDMPGGNLADQMMPAYERAGQFYDAFMPKPKTEAREKLKERVQEGLSEASQKKEKDYDKWSTLAEIGFNIAGSNTPNFLQAVGAAASAALPGAKKAKEAREARADKLLTQYAEIEGIENAEARQRVSFMLDFGKTELELKDKDLTRGTNWAIQTMQDATQRRGQNLNYDASIFGTKKQFEASMAGSKANVDAIMKQGYNLAYQGAEDDVKSVQEYIEGDAATRDRIFNDALARRLAAYERMVGGAGGTGSAPQLPPGFVPDKR